MMTTSDRPLDTPSFFVDYAPAVIYVAAPYHLGKTDALSVYHKIFDLGHVSSSRWILAAEDEEDLLSKSDAEIEFACAQNDADVRSSDGLVALCFPGEGREMFAEAALARLCGIPILWVAEDFSTLSLSAFRHGSLRARSFEEGFSSLLHRCFPKIRR